MSTPRRLIALLAPHKMRVALILLGLAAMSVLGFLGPWLTKLLIDKVIEGRNYALLRVYVPLILANTVGKATIEGFVGYSREILGQSILRDLKQRMYDHVQTLPMSYFAQAQTGQLMSRFISDADQTRVFLAFAVIDMFNVVVTFAVAVIFLAKLSWPLALACLSFIPLLVREVLSFRGRIRTAWTAIQRQVAALNARLQESITGIRVVKAFCREGYEARRFSKENKKNYLNQMKANHISSQANPYMDFLGGLSWIILLAYGGYLVILGHITIGTFVAFNGYLWNLIWPVRHLGWIVNVFGQASASADRVFEVLDTRPGIKSPSDGRPSEVSGHVRFDRVSVRYGGRFVLRNISFEAKPGQVVAIVGRTGAGKSTLVNLVSRFVDPTSGAVYIDGVDARHHDLESLRQQVGVVFQETFLFSDTLANNITYGRPSATDEERELAIRRAEAYDFISALDDGYEAEVGERGVGLSGGQKQRVAIARAFLKDPKILVLDDATSALDMRTEFRIFGALRALMRDRTTLVVAQRLMTIKEADLILVMDKGEIVERGTHEELLSARGLYRSIFDEQYKGIKGVPEEVSASGS